MKTLLSLLPNSFVLWLNKVLNKNKYTVKKGSFYDYVFEIDLATAVADSGKMIAGWVGDSRQQEFTPQINAIPNHLGLGLSGSKLEDWISRGLPIVQALKAKFIVDDLGGNNFLAGDTLADVQALKKKWVDMIISTGSKPILIEMCPLGQGALATFPGRNELIAQFNAWVETQGWTVAKINSVLAPGGFMLPQYTVDNIHFSALAWTVIKDSVLAHVK